MRSEPLARLRLLAWCVGLVGALWFLHLVGRGDLGTPPLTSLEELRSWPEAVGAATAVVAVVRLLALGCAWYLLIVTVVGAIARSTGTTAVQVHADRATPGFVRGLLSSASTATAAGLTLAVSPLLVPSVAETPSSAADETAAAATMQPSSEAPVMRPGSPVPMMRIVAPPAPAPPSSPVAPLTLPEDELILAASIPLAQTTPTEVWEVATGDHFWGIAADVLHDAWGRAATEAEVARYWQMVIDHNRAELADPDNPDLIYPGQRFSLPTPPAVTE